MGRAFRKGQRANGMATATARNLTSRVPAVLAVHLLVIWASPSPAATLRLDANPAGRWYALRAQVDAGSWDIYTDFVDLQGHTVVHIGPDACEVARVSGGHREVLAVRHLEERGPKRLTVLRHGDIAALAVSGRIVARWRPATQGRCGWASESGVGPKRFRVQHTEPIFFTDDFMRASDERGGWSERSGRWIVDHVPHPDFSASPFRYLQDQDTEAIALAGEWHWANVSVSAAVRVAATRSTVGVLVAAQDERGFHALRYDASRHRIELVRRRKGRDVVLQARPLDLGVGQWHALRLDASPGSLAAFVNGTPALQAEDPHVVCGKVGVYALRARGALFDDVAVVDLTQRHRAPQPGRDARITPYFTTQKTMATWSTPAGDWVGPEPDEDGWRWHKATLFDEVSLHVPLPRTLARRDLALVLFGDPGQPDRGARVDLTCDAARRWTAALQIDGKPIASAALPRTPPNGSLAFTWSKHRVTLSVAGKSVLEADRQQARPAGRVGIRTRRSRFPAAAARVTSPNVLDYPFQRAPVHWRTERGDWRITPRWFCTPRHTWLQGGGRDLAIAWHRVPFDGDVSVEMNVCPRMAHDSSMGYRAVRDFNVSICADGQSPATGYTFFFGGWQNSVSRLMRRSLAVADDTATLLPNRKYPVHKGWWHVKLERVGKRVRAFVDGALSAEFEDPEPLRGRYLALWTWRNTLMYARVRVSYRRSLPVPLRPPPEPGQPDARRAAAVGLDDFEAGYGDWRAVSGSSRIRRRTRKTGGHCLEVTNARAGGRFSVVAHPRPFTAANAPTVSFDMQAPPSVRTDMLLRASGRWWRIRLSGRACRERGYVTLGRVAGWSANGQWGHIAFNLTDVLQGFVDNPSALRIDEVRLENRDEEDYLGAGYGGNEAGASFRVDNFFVGPPAEAPRRAPPSISGRDPESGATTGDGRVRFTVVTGDAGLDPKRLRVSANGRAISFGEPGMRWDPFRGEVRLDLGEAGHVLQDGARVRVKVELRDRLGQTLREAVTWAWQHRWSDDQRAPDKPSVRLPAPPRFRHDFERSMNGWDGYRVSLPAGLWLQTGRAASGRRSLALELDRLGSSWSAVAYHGLVDLRRYPVLTFFEHRERPGPSRVHALQRGAWEPVADFTARADGAWRQRVVPLRSTALSDRLLLGRYWADTACSWGRTGQFAYVDDVRLLATQGSGGKLRLAWGAHDASGIEGFRVVFDRNPWTVPQGAWTQETERVLPKPVGGLYYLHVDCRDHAGNVSEVTHEPVPVAAVVDTRPPTAKIVTPHPGAESGSAEVHVRLGDTESDVDLASIALHVDGQRYDLAHPTLRYDRYAGMLTWSAERARSPRLVLADSRTVHCRLEAQDLAGHALAPVEWQWVFRRRLDRRAPAAPYVSWRPTDRLFYDDYEHGPGRAGPRRSAVIWMETEEPALGRRAVRLGGWANNLWEGRFRFGRWPIVSLDYLAPSGVCPYFCVELGGAGAVFGLVSDHGRNVNAVPDAYLWTDDDAWHHWALPFRCLPGTKADGTTMLFLRRTRGHPSHGIAIDNLCVGSLSQGVEFLWQPPPDASGIRGYAVRLDASPDTIPQQRVNCTEARYLVGQLTRPATWLHVRACDNAGNWGPTAHAKVDVAALSPP